MWLRVCAPLPGMVGPMEGRVDGGVNEELLSSFIVSWLWSMVGCSFMWRIGCLLMSLVNESKSGCEREREKERRSSTYSKTRSKWSSSGIDHSFFSFLEVKIIWPKHHAPSLSPLEILAFLLADASPSFRPIFWLFDASPVIYAPFVINASHSLTQVTKLHYHIAWQGKTSKPFATSSLSTSQFVFISFIWVVTWSLIGSLFTAVKNEKKYLCKKNHGVVVKSYSLFEDSCSLLLH